MYPERHTRLLSNVHELKGITINSINSVLGVAMGTGTENSGPGPVQGQRIRSRSRPEPDSLCENL